MNYREVVSLYESLSETTKKLEKTRLLASFLPSLLGNEDWIYLLRGRVFPDYDMREFGISSQLTLKALSKASGKSVEEVGQMYRKLGDFGDVAYSLFSKHKQSSLVSQRLTVHHVFSSLRKLTDISGSGAVDKKLALISELLISASAAEARYIVRTLLSDLRVGVADALLVDAIALCFFKDEEEMKKKIKRAYDFLTDFSLVLRMVKKKHSFDNVELVPGRPLNVMLAVKTATIEDAFEMCGKPAAFEHKYDGFRVVIGFDGKEVTLHTRRLENVTHQFPDIVDYAKKFISAKNYILDAEVVGYDPSNKKYVAFEAISQRIKRKYDISTLIQKLPVEVKVFDILYYDGLSCVDLPFSERRKILSSLINEEPYKLTISEQIVSESVREVSTFYSNALKIGEEGIMIKNLSSNYMPGRAVGHMAKLKPEVKDLDVVIVGAEYGTGKRVGGLTSFTIACKDGEQFLEIGKVSSGLKEKSEQGFSYGELDALLKPHIIKEEGNTVQVSPSIVVSVTYQNIQPSPKYSSGYALRFPKVTHYRPERGIGDIVTLSEITSEFNKVKRRRKSS